MRIATRKMISIRLPENILALVGEKASSLNISKTEFIIKCIEEKIHREDLIKAIK